MCNFALAKQRLCYLNHHNCKSNSRLNSKKINIRQKLWSKNLDRTKLMRNFAPA